MHCVICFHGQSQLAYSLLYCVWVVTQKTKSIRDLDRPADLINLALFALEMCRLRTVAPRNSVRAMEHSWLLKLETQLCTYLLTCDNATTCRPVMLYVDALRSVKCRFYDGAYPLALLDLLLQFSTTTRSMDTRRDAIVHICADILMDSRNPLEKFTLPTSSLFDIVMDSELIILSLFLCLSPSLRVSPPLSLSLSLSLCVVSLSISLALSLFPLSLSISLPLYLFSFFSLSFLSLSPSISPSFSLSLALYYRASIQYRLTPLFVDSSDGASE